MKGEVTREVYEDMEARMGAKGAVEFTTSVLFVMAIRRLIQAVWAMQGYTLSDRSTDYGVVQSYIDGSAPVHGYDRLSDVVKKATT